MQRTATKRRSSSHPPTPLAGDLAGIAVIAIGVVSLVSVASPQEAGEFGRDINSVLRLLAGIGAYLFPLLAIGAGVTLLFGQLRVPLTRRLFAAAGLWVVVISWLHVSISGGNPRPDVYFQPALMRLGGGYIGAGVSYFLLVALGKVSTLVVLGALALALAMVTVDVALFSQIAGFVRNLRTQQPEDPAARKPRTDPRAASKTSGDDEDESSSAEPKVDRRSMIARAIEARKRQSEEQQTDSPAGPERQISVNGHAKNGAQQPALSLEDIPPQDKEFVLPPLEILEEPPPTPERSADELNENVEIIERTLSDFKIEANVVEIAHGPTVTRYEIELAPGIRVNKIVSLADNIAMSLSAINVRVEAPIPGKAAIGVEVPNRHRGMVGLKDLLRSPDMVNHPSKLAFPLGFDVSGQPIIADLAEMPHLLVAGATGMGKSVMLNALISSLLFRSTPGEVRMVMIDPKRVELSLFDGVAHLCSPVIRNVRGAAGIFKAAVQEMDRRYDRLEQKGTRNIHNFNTQVEPSERMPYIVIVVDELADLMMQAAQEVEGSIVRLAQLARAVGIHLVLATQRPSVDVVTGLIKANIASRVAFAVSSHIDSRTILDVNGAERLIGKGDMLFRPMDAPKPMRIQGAFISEGEVKKLVEHLKGQRKPEYTLTPVETGAAGEGGARGAGDDPALADEFYLPAVEMVIRQGRASTSMIQRRFRIGYTRAARLVDAMEQQGLVGAADGANPREVLVSPERIDEILGLPPSGSPSDDDYEPEEDDAF
ncbi:MAG: DNA translocase FtsK [Armatimonadetes bacterium]|nr:DNA translocase FtsK [Armatimonadota bacterium]